MGDEKINGGGKVAKWSLVVLNTIFLVLGLVLFILGMIVRFSPNIIVNNYIQPLLADNNNNNPTQLGNQIQAQINNIDLSAVFSVVGIVMISIGAIMLIVGFLGLIGSCCQVRCMLILYAIIVILMLLIQFGVCIAYFARKDDVDALIKSELQTAINREYRGEEATDAYSAALNFLFVEGECCGVTNYLDFRTATRWRKQHFVGGQSYTLAHPFTCCKLQGTFPNYQRPTDLTCAVTPTAVNSNFQTGCFQVIDNFISGNVTTPVIIVFVILAAIEIAAVVFAILLTVAVGRSEW